MLCYYLFYLLCVHTVTRIHLFLVILYCCVLSMIQILTIVSQLASCSLHLSGFIPIPKLCLSVKVLIYLQLTLSIHAMKPLNVFF